MGQRTTALSRGRGGLLFSVLFQTVCLVSLLQGQLGWPELGMVEPLEEVFPGTH